MSGELVHVDRSQAGVAVLSMQRGDKRNALNIALLHSLIDALERLEQDGTCRVAILRGDGPVFCAGLDLVEANDPATAEVSAEGVRRVLETVQRSRLIVIAAGHGGAYAGGAGLFAACDLTVASDDFKIGFPEVRRGLVAAIVSSVLVRKVCSGDIAELLLVGEPVDAVKAQIMGLIQWIVPTDQVSIHAQKIAKSILAGGPEALRETKQLLNLGPGSVNLDYLKALHERIRHSAEAREGLAAFRDRREPNWCKVSS